MLDSKPQHGIQQFWKIKHPISGGLHFLGFLGAITAIIYYLAHPNRITQLDGRIYSYVFLTTMALLYLSSSLYHLLVTSEVITARLRKLDHAMISLFIAGTITPFCLSFENPTVKFSIIASIWLLALTGVVFTSLFTSTSRWARVGVYVALSFFGLFAVFYGIQQLSAHVLIWLVTGGVAYLLGSVVYALKRPNPFPKYFGFHEIWHIFVLVGCTCHFVAVESYLSDSFKTVESAYSASVVVNIPTN